MRVLYRDSFAVISWRASVRVVKKTYSNRLKVSVLSFSKGIWMSKYAADNRSNRGRFGTSEVVTLICICGFHLSDIGDVFIKQPTVSQTGRIRVTLLLGAKVKDLVDCLLEIFDHRNNLLAI